MSAKQEASDELFSQPKTLNQSAGDENGCRDRFLRFRASITSSKRTWSIPVDIATFIMLFYDLFQECSSHFQPFYGYSNRITLKDRKLARMSKLTVLLPFCSRD